MNKEPGGNNDSPQYIKARNELRQFILMAEFKKALKNGAIDIQAVKRLTDRFLEQHKLANH